MVWVIQRLSSLRSHPPVGVAQLWIVRRQSVYELERPDAIFQQPASVVSPGNGGRLFLDGGFGSFTLGFVFLGT